MADESATASTALQSMSLADLLPPRLHTRCFGPSIDTILRLGAGAAEHVAITAGGKKEEAGELARSLPHVSVASATRRLRWATVDSARAQAQSYRPPSPHDKVPERLAEVIAPIFPYLSHGKEQLVNGLRKLEGGGELYVPCIDSNETAFGHASRLVYHGTAISRLPAIFAGGLLPSFGAGRAAAEKKFKVDKPVVYTSPKFVCAKGYPMAMVDTANNAAGELVANDAPPLRAVMWFCANLDKRRINLRRDKNNWQDWHLPGDLHILGVHFIAMANQ